MFWFMTPEVNKSFLSLALLAEWRPVQSRGASARALQSALCTLFYAGHIMQVINCLVLSSVAEGHFYT